MKNMLIVIVYIVGATLTHMICNDRLNGSSKPIQFTPMYVLAIILWPITWTAAIILAIADAVYEKFNRF